MAMIQNRRDLNFYISADRIMLGLPEKRSVKEIILDVISKGGMIICYLHAMRKYAYYANVTLRGQFGRALLRLYWGRRFRKLGVKLGFSIGHNSIGYGVVIPHYGTIVVNGEARIGNFAVLHTCTCIAGKKEIGDYLYLSTGSQITGDIILGDGVTIAAHSLVNKSSEGHVLLAGSPAVEKRTNYPLWVERDGEVFAKRIETVNLLKARIYNI